ncbi:hypothetical protein C4573_06195 [Candidatus Woesearchaeota archaeon]|nr:MAG: hypothetical protein C4573_06195 [Candidatus Woesearchaeota archaeon]
MYFPPVTLDQLIAAFGRVDEVYFYTQSHRLGELRVVDHWTNHHGARYIIGVHLRQSVTDQMHSMAHEAVHIATQIMSAEPYKLDPVHQAIDDEAKRLLKEQRAYLAEQYERWRYFQFGLKPEQQVLFSPQLVLPYGESIAENL